MQREICVLGPVTSLLVWRAAQNGMVDYPWREELQPDLARGHSRLRDIRELPVVRALGEVPLDVLVGHRRHAHRTSSMHVIVLAGQLPHGSFWCVGRDTYVCSPELCFALLGRGGEVVHLAELGCELCGTYALMPDQSGEFCNCPALTNKEALTAFLVRWGRRHGCVAARRALALVTDGSDSPRETSVFLGLCAPERMGGYALRWPTLNEDWDVPERSQATLGKRTIKVDQMFRDDSGKRTLVGEYDSKEHHFAGRDDRGEPALNVSKIIADDKRREVIRDAGLDVVTIRREDTLTLDAFEVKAMRMARLVGDSPHLSGGRLRAKRLLLFESLFGRQRWAQEHETLTHMAGHDRLITHERAA